MMSSDIEQRLAASGIVLPVPLAPSATYIPCRVIGNLLYLSGHGPRFPDGTYSSGRLETVEDVSRGQAAARHTALNMLATIKMALGSLDRVECFVKLLGMVNAGPDFKHHPQVINGCSDLLVQAFGNAGQHARSAVGMGSLPHGMLVEIEAIVAIRL